ncbi:sigma factor-like helix-turn-helix DNA-binding protein [[Actinomadura] parvosata]|uniref:sigma factor-like helix-turn-helix DNA-binding protein n=1 Tax=[Actinomadura] parvosata TaxID=1955412 RepID=UPI00406CFD65
MKRLPTSSDQRSRGAGVAGPDGDDALADFLEARATLLQIARRIVTTTDAEDVVQDTWLRWSRTDRTVVRNARAFLACTTQRLSITRTQCAYARHQIPAGLTVDDPPELGADPARIAEDTDELRAAMAVLVVRLGPRERVAYLLREAFALPYRNVGELLGLTEPHTRQVLRRARARLATGPDRSVPRAEKSRLLAVFLDAARRGDLAALADLARTN